MFRYSYTCSDYAETIWSVENLQISTEWRTCTIRSSLWGMENPPTWIVCDLQLWECILNNLRDLNVRRFIWFFGLSDRAVDKESNLILKRINFDYVYLKIYWIFLIDAVFSIWFFMKMYRNFCIGNSYSIRRRNQFLKHFALQISFVRKTLNRELFSKLLHSRCGKFAQRFSISFGLSFRADRTFGSSFPIKRNWTLAKSQFSHYFAFSKYIFSHYMRAFEIAPNVWLENLTLFCAARVNSYSSRKFSPTKEISLKASLMKSF